MFWSADYEAEVSISIIVWGKMGCVMTLELPLSPELEARLRADAAARQMPVETLAARAVEAYLSPPIQILPKGQRRPAIEAARGSLRGLLNSDEFLAERHAEAIREAEKDGIITRSES